MTQGWWPSRRPCGGGPRWRLSFWWTTRSATSEGLAALVAPGCRRRRQVRALLSPAAGLAKLKTLALYYSPITDAGCAALAAALDIGTLPALEEFYLYGTSAKLPMPGDPKNALMARHPTPTPSQPSIKSVFRYRSLSALTTLKLINDELELSAFQFPASCDVSLPEA